MKLDPGHKHLSVVNVLDLVIVFYLTKYNLIMVNVSFNATTRPTATRVMHNYHIYA